MTNPTDSTTELFRFLTVRAPQYVDPTKTIQLQVPAAAIKQLLAARPKESGLHLGAGQNNSPTPSLPALKLATQFDAARDALILNVPTPANIAKDLTTAFGQPDIRTLASNADLLADVKTLHPAILAAHLTPNPSANEVGVLADYIRLSNLISVLASPSAPADPTELLPYLSSIILTPPNVLPLLELGTPYNPFVVPAGVADLLVVEQQLSGYETKEISYIANVLASETSTRTTVRFQESNQTFTTSTDTTNETEQDTQTNQRYQVQTQAQNTIQDSTNQQFGVSISAQYGPWVQAKSNYNLGSNQSSTDSTSTATTYAKDITSRTVNKVTQEVKQMQRQQIISSFREKIEHGFVNTNQGAKNITGIYQYVDELYEVGIFQYGSRLLLDLIVPDPAAVVRQAIASLFDSAMELQSPQPPTLQVSPSDLTVPASILRDYELVPLANTATTDYTSLAAAYQVSGLAGPPPPVTTVVYTQAQTNPSANDPGGIPPINDTITIPSGYMATGATITAMMAELAVSPTPVNYNVSVALGNTWQWFGHDTGTEPASTPVTVDLAGEVGSLGVGIGAGVISQYDVTIEVDCALTNEAFAAWQMTTYGAIAQAYFKELGEYQQAAMQAQASQATTYPGSSPSENAAVISTEIKRALINMLILESPGELVAGTPMTAADAALGNANANLDISGISADGPIIRFFEEAFEWDEMQYAFYPYYWHEEQQWLNLALLENPDPLFTQFLRAGAARAVAPVRPGFENALLYYLQFGRVWDGTGTPQVYDPLYLPIAVEIAEMDQEPTDAVLVGDAWQMALPTTLTMLRGDSTLPSWTLDSDLQVTASN